MAYLFFLKHLVTREWHVWVLWSVGWDSIASTTVFWIILCRPKNYAKSNSNLLKNTFRKKCNQKQHVLTFWYLMAVLGMIGGRRDGWNHYMFIFISIRSSLMLIRVEIWSCVSFVWRGWYFGGYLKRRHSFYGDLITYNS